MIDNKIEDKITNVLRTLPQNSSGKVPNETENIELDRKIPKERYISPEKMKKIIYNLRLIYYYNNAISKNNKFVR